jgi:CheY-like chemotaxis protein/HPt (histidine-containing phosphotransfer) domain-containing protein
MNQAEEMKLDGFLIKPVSPSVLFNTVVQALNVDTQWELPKKTLASQALRLIGKILLVEDNSINQQLAQEILTSMGTEFCCADNGRQTLAMLNEQVFDLVLMDIQMPEMDGYETTRRIRAEPRYNELPIVAMTAQAIPEKREKCLDMGMNGHVSKPIDPEVLFKTLQQWLKTETRNPTAISRDNATDRDDDLPDELPGIDVAWELERIGGNRKLLHKLLSEFSAKHSNSLKIIEPRLAEGDMATVRRELHTPQGVTGNIGARALKTATKAYESDLRQGKAVTAEDIPTGFREAFLSLFNTLSRLPETRNSSSPTKPRDTDSSLTSEALTSQLKELHQLLMEDNSGAYKLVNRIMEETQNKTLHETLQLINSALENYDFDAALQALKTSVTKSKV